MLLNSCATLDANAPTLLMRWACINCWRSWSVSERGVNTSSLIIKRCLLIPPFLRGGHVSSGVFFIGFGQKWYRFDVHALFIGTHCEISDYAMQSGKTGRLRSNG